MSDRDERTNGSNRPISNIDQEDLEIDPRGVDDAVNAKAEDMRIDMARLFTQATEQTRMALCVSDPRQDDCPIVYVNEAFVMLTGYDREEVVGRNCRFLQGEDTDPKAVEAIRAALEKEEVRVIDILNYRKDGSAFWNALHVGPMFDEAGELQYFYGSQWDVTEIFEKRERVTMQDSVAQELQHRTGNLFGIINAIVRLSEKGSETVADYRKTVSERLTALHRAHSLSIGNKPGEERPADLRELLTAIMAPYRNDTDGRINLVGADVELVPADATPIGMAMHELATNALKYGSLSKSGGQIDIDWCVKDGHLVIDWEEKGGPPVEPVDGAPKTGTGHRIIQGALTQLGGSLDYNLRPSGLNATIRIPHDG